MAISGAGAAGIAMTKLLRHTGVMEIVVSDSRVIIHLEREDLNPYKRDSEVQRSQE